MDITTNLPCELQYKMLEYFDVEEIPEILSKYEQELSQKCPRLLERLVKLNEWYESDVIDLIEKGDLEGVIWSVENKHLDITEEMLESAISNEHLDILKWFEGQGVNIKDEYLVDIASQLDDTEIFKYLVSIGAKVPPMAIEFIVGEEDVELIEFMLENGSVSPSYMVSMIILNGDMDMLVDLVNDGDLIITPEIIETVSYMTSQNAIDALEFFDELGFDLSDDDLIQNAVYSGDVGMVKYFINKGGNIDQEGIVESAARNGTLKMLKWLISLGVDFDLDKALDNSRYNYNNDDVYEWLEKNYSRLME